MFSMERWPSEHRQLLYENGLRCAADADAASVAVLGLLLTGLRLICMVRLSPEMLIKVILFRKRAILRAHQHWSILRWGTMLLQTSQLVFLLPSQRRMSAVVM